MTELAASALGAPAPVEETPAPRRQTRRRALIVASAAALPLALMLGWTLLTSVLHRFGPSVLPGPPAILSALRELLGTGELLRHVGASLLRVAVGFGIGALLAVGLASLVGFSATARRMLDPTLQGLRAIPSLAWVPFLLLWLGIGEAPRITLVAIGAFFPIYVNVSSGIRNVDRKLVELGQLHGLRGARLVREIVLPAASPALLTGLRLGLGQAWLFLVAAELIAASRGLGFLLVDGQASARADLMVLALLLLALLGRLTDGVLRAVELRLLGWTDGFAR